MDLSHLSNKHPYNKFQLRGRSRVEIKKNSSKKMLSHLIGAASLEGKSCLSYLKKISSSCTGEVHDWVK